MARRQRKPTEFPDKVVDDAAEYGWEKFDEFEDDRGHVNITHFVELPHGILWLHAIYSPNAGGGVSSSLTFVPARPRQGPQGR